jgi:hypothetical protein
MWQWVQQLERGEKNHQQKGCHLHWNACSSVSILTPARVAHCLHTRTCCRWRLWWVCAPVGDSSSQQRCGTRLRIASFTSRRPDLRGRSGTNNTGMAWHVHAVFAGRRRHPRSCRAARAAAVIARRAPLAVAGRGDAREACIGSGGTRRRCIPWRSSLWSAALGRHERQREGGRARRKYTAKSNIFIKPTQKI